MVKIDGKIGFSETFSGIEGHFKAIFMYSQSSIIHNGIGFRKGNSIKWFTIGKEFRKGNSIKCTRRTGHRFYLNWSRISKGEFVGSRIFRKLGVTRLTKRINSWTRLLVWYVGEQFVIGQDRFNGRLSRIFSVYNGLILFLY